MKPAIIFGGYGVFGTHIARALAGWGTPITIAGRDQLKAETLARDLGGDCRALVVDIGRAESCRAALQAHSVAVNCAGPFQEFDATLLQCCLDVGCHYADIADDRRYVAMVRSFDDAFRNRNLAAVYGCSSLPGISGALATMLRESATAPVARVRVTMFIGGRNPKGRAAFRSFLSSLGKPIAGPQGMLMGFGDREVVSLPPPFGRRAVYNFESPDYDLFPAQLGAEAVSVKVGFESRLITNAFALCVKLGLGPRLAKWADVLETPARWFSGFGCRGGTVMTELFLQGGSIRRAALHSPNEGQRMAAMPCAFVARTLLGDGVILTGASTAYELLGARALVDEMVAEGFDVHV